MFNVFFNRELFAISDEEEEAAIKNFVESFEDSLDKEVVLREIFELRPGFNLKSVTGFVEENWDKIIKEARELREIYPDEFERSFFDTAVEDFINAYMEQGE